MSKMSTCPLMEVLNPAAGYISNEYSIMKDFLVTYSMLE